MMDIYSIVKTVHILSSTILFGTGIGIAFFMFGSRWAKNPHERYFAARWTVMADYIFTAPAVILQPLSGIWLIAHGGFDPMAPWLTATYGLYILAGVCWLPVVWLQIQMRNMAKDCAEKGLALPQRYHRYFTWWFLLGWPAFIGLIVIFYLMVAKPA